MISTSGRFFVFSSKCVKVGVVTDRLGPGIMLEKGIVEVASVVIALWPPKYGAPFTRCLKSS